MKKILFLFFIICYTYANAQPQKPNASATDTHNQNQRQDSGNSLPNNQQLRKTENKIDSITASSQYLIKQIMKWTSAQSYVNLVPYTDLHFGSKATFPHYLITADIYPNFFIGSESRNKVMVSLAPRFNARLTFGNEYSHRYKTKLDWNYSQPVRTPSYMPEIAIYYIPKNENFKNFIRKYRREKESADTTLSKTKESLRVEVCGKYNYVKFSALHHSNGQDGSHDKDVTRRIFETLGNRPESYRHYQGGYPGYLNDRYFNIYNGNFANDLVLQGFYAWGYYTLGEEEFSRIKHLSKSSGDSTFHNHRDDKLESFEVGLQVVPLMGETQLKNRYGLTKILFRYQNIKAAYYNKVMDLKTPLSKRDPDSKYERWRVVIDASLALNSLKSSYNWDNQNVFSKALTRLNFEVKLIPNFNNLLQSNSTSLYFSAGWKGQDDYNIFLEDSFAFLKVGFCLGHKIYDDKRNKGDDLLFESQTIQSNPKSN